MYIQILTYVSIQYSAGTTFMLDTQHCKSKQSSTMYRKTTLSISFNSEKSTANYNTSAQKLSILLLTLNTIA